MAKLNRFVVVLTLCGNLCPKPRAAPSSGWKQSGSQRAKKSLVAAERVYALTASDVAACLSAFLQVALVIFLGAPEGLRRNDLGDDSPGLVAALGG